MLPNRPTLRGWDPSRLSAGGSALLDSGASVETAVSGVDSACRTLPELKAWSGASHDAATAMFGRTSVVAAGVADFAEAVGNAIAAGAEPIGSARRALLSKADDVDAGELGVTDAWVVVIDPAEMTAEEADRMESLAIAEQAEINRLLLAVGAADDDVAKAIETAAAKHGFVNPAASSPVPLLIPGLTKPGDEVPNPASQLGLYQQSLVRAEDMGVTVREVTEHEDQEGNRVKTMYMQDGSRQVVMQMNPYRGPVATQRMNEIRAVHYDKTGQVTSSTSSWEEFDGKKVFSVGWSDGTVLHSEEWPDGYKEARVTTADGRSGEISPDSPFFSHPVATSVGGALSGVERYVDDGRSIPKVSAAAADSVRVGAKYGGPAIGVATMVYDVATADTAHDACVAGISGVFGLAGGAAGGVAGGLGAGPVGAGVAATAGGLRRRMGRDEGR